MSRPKKYKVALSKKDYTRLKDMCEMTKSPKTICQRCKILLALDELRIPHMSYKQCISELGVSRGTIASTVKLYSSGGVDEVLKIHRNVNSNNARRKFDEDIKTRIIEIASGPVPEGHSQWTIRLLEERMKVELNESISRETIRRILKTKKP